MAMHIIVQPSTLWEGTARFHDDAGDEELNLVHLHALLIKVMSKSHDNDPVLLLQGPTVK